MGKIADILAEYEKRKKESEQMASQYADIVISSAERIKKLEESQKKEKQLPVFLFTPVNVQSSVLPDDSKYLLQNYKRLHNSDVENGNRMPFYSGTTIGPLNTDITRKLPKQKSNNTTTESAIKSALFGLTEGAVGKGTLSGMHSAGMKYLFDYEGDSPEEYDRYKKMQITGNANNELNTTENAINILGQVAGNATAYRAGNAAVKGLGSRLSGTKLGTAIKRTDPVKYLSGAKWLNQPFTKNLLAGQLVDTVVQTPRVISEGISSKEKPSEIISRVARQQGTDFLWNLGFETVGQIPSLPFLGNFERKNVPQQTENMLDILGEVPGSVAKNVISPKNALSDDTISALQRIQSIADRAGKDFSDIADAIFQGKTMNEYKPYIEKFASYVSKSDSSGKIQRINVDDMGRVSVERGINADVPIQMQKNSFISMEFESLPNSTIEKVIRDEGLPFRNAKDVKKCAAFADKVVTSESGTSMIGLDSPQTKTRRQKVLSSFKGKIRDWLEDNLVDRYSVVKAFDMVDRETSTENYLQMYLQSGSTAEYIKKVSLVDPEGKSIGKSLDDIFMQIKRGDRKDFDEYLFHKYNYERMENGVPLDIGIGQYECAQRIAELEKLHPNFSSVSEELYEFNRELNRAWALDTGIISKSQYDNQNAVYPSYVPTYREYGDIIDSGDTEKVGHGIVNVFRSASSRAEKIADVQTLMANKVDILVNAGRRQQLFQNMILKVMHHPSKLAHLGRILDYETEFKNAASEAMLDGQDLMYNLKQLYSDSAGDVYVLSAYIDGKLHEIGINERLHNAFSYVTAGGNQKLKDSMQKKIDIFGKYVTGTFKKLVTGLNPLFGMRNVFRDVPNALITTTGGMGEMAKHYPEAIAKILRRDASFRQFCALGGCDLGIVESVVSHQKYNPLLWFQKMNCFTEAIPRYSEFLISVKHGDDVYTALRNSAEVTVNFSRGGRLVKNIDKILIPYINARFQGLYHSAKQFNGIKNTGRTMARGTIALTVPTVICFCLNHNNPHYQDLTERQKNYYFNIPNFLGPRDENGCPTNFFKIPKTDQFGFMFGSMVERGMRAAFGDDEAFDNLWENFSDGMLPVNTRNFTENFYSPAWRGVVENMILKNSDIRDFANREIIPYDIQDFPPEQQYDETTSEIGIWLGKALGISPKVVDYLIKSYTGFIGEVTLPYLQKNSENRMIQPLIRNFTIDSLYSNDVPATWYNIYSDMRSQRDAAKDAGDYVKYYQYSGYVSDLWKANNSAKQLRGVIDQMVENGASKHSDAVRRLREQYLNIYKNAIKKYEFILKGE